MPVSHFGTTDFPLYDFRNKKKAFNSHLATMFSRTQSMFTYSGLPDSIPARMVEIYLQQNGSLCIAEEKGSLYAFTGGFGGEPDPYYRPTLYTVANPALKLSKNYEIDKNCVVIGNDSFYRGLYPIFSRYASALVENELSMFRASISMRAVFHLSHVRTDADKASAEKYLSAIEDGTPAAMGESPFMDTLKIQPGAFSSSNLMTNLIEYEQYLRASWFNDLGLNANYNMKRETINSGESQLNDDMLLPLIDDMLNCRKRGLEKVNSMFGTAISVDFASAWKDNQIELEKQQRADPVKEGDPVDNS